jgi:two-component system, chemotaxis family, protein-glutamate methylesterase/glutaminase
MIKVLIVDDSSIARSIISEVLRQHSDIQVIGFCTDGTQVDEAIAQLAPDVITLDVEMPKLDGPSLLKRWSGKMTTPVVMVSSVTYRGAQMTLDCLSLGASDFVTKPNAENYSASIAVFANELVQKIRIAAQLNKSSTVDQANNPRPVLSISAKNADRKKLIVIGASTGGPRAVETLLRAMPLNCPSILVAIHMPSPFTQFYAQRLNKFCALTVKEAVHGEEIKDGTVYVSPGSMHMKVITRTSLGLKQLFVNLSPPAAGDLYKPSVDKLFESAAAALGSDVIACVLTGMGRDGTAGASAIKEKGGYVIAQDERSSAIYGMPKAIVSAGLADSQGNPESMPLLVINQLDNHST